MKFLNSQKHVQNAGRKMPDIEWDEEEKQVIWHIAAIHGITFNEAVNLILRDSVNS